MVEVNLFPKFAHKLKIKQQFFLMHHGRVRRLAYELMWLGLIFFKVVVFKIFSKGEWMHEFINNNENWWFIIFLQCSAIEICKVSHCDLILSVRQKVGERTDKTVLRNKKKNNN